MSPGMLVRVDPAAAAFVAVAIRAARIAKQRADIDVPDQVQDLEFAFAELARDHRDRSRVISRAITNDDQEDERDDWISVAEAAHMTGKSEVTVRRRIKDGTLRSKPAGRRRLVARADLFKLADVGVGDTGARLPRSQSGAGDNQEAA